MSGNIPGLSRQVLVHIDLTGDGVHVFPQRSGDTVIYHCEQGVHPRGRPSEVRWVVEGLAPGQSLRIKPRTEAGAEMFGLKAGEYFEVTHPDDSVTSGCPRNGVGHDHHVVWSYDVEVTGTPTPMTLDPGIIIKDYP